MCIVATCINIIMRKMHFIFEESCSVQLTVTNNRNISLFSETAEERSLKLCMMVSFLFSLHFDTCFSYCDLFSRSREGLKKYFSI